MINGVSATGTNLATAFPLPAQGDVLAFDVQSVPAGSGVILPQAVQSRIIFFIRNSGANDLLVYPIPSGTIDGSLSPVSVAAGGVLELWALSALDWVQVEGGGAAALPTTGLTITQHAGAITTDTPSAGAVTCNLATSDAHQVTMVASTLITLSNPPSGKRQAAILYLIQPASGGPCVPTFSPTVTWGAAGIPVWSIAANKVDIVVLDWNGTSYRGSVVGIGY